MADAAQEQPLECAQPSCSHNDQISLPNVGHADNRFRGRSLQQFQMDIQLIRQQLLSLIQNFLSGALAAGDQFLVFVISQQIAGLRKSVQQPEGGPKRRG